MWRQLMWVAGAGALGTVARYGLSELVQRTAGQGSGFPWGTLAVNAAGCLLFGVVWGLAEERGVVSSQARVIVLVGFLGAFTTFSSFAFETAQLMKQSQWVYAAANVAVQNVLGMAMMFVGVMAARWWG